jgi:hypothetical protein
VSRWRQPRVVRAFLLAGTSFVAVIAIVAPGGPQPRTSDLIAADGLDRACAAGLAGAAAFWLEGSWWCGGTSRGLWDIEPFDSARACGTRAVNDVSPEGVRCDR